MRIDDALRRIAQEERTACAATLPQAAAKARAPIEQWRHSDIGKALEARLHAVLAEPPDVRVAQLSAIARDHDQWLPFYLELVFRHLAANPDWQPPLADFRGEGQSGLHLIDTDQFRMSLILPRSMSVPLADPPIITMASGHVLIAPLDDGEALILRHWALHQAPSGTRLVRQPDRSLAKGQVIHCQLSQGFVRLIPPDHPRLLLRFDWPEEVPANEVHFDTHSGAALHQMTGNAGLRRHLALCTLSTLAPQSAVPYLQEAISDAPDDALAWHYCRHLLAANAQAALPELEALVRHGTPALRALAEQSLAALRLHYPQMFEAA